MAGVSLLRGCKNAVGVQESWIGIKWSFEKQLVYVHVFLQNVILVGPTWCL